MASLQIPLAIWKGNLDLNVTCVLHDEESKSLFLGLNSGHILRLHFCPETAEMWGEALYCGHCQPIHGLALTLIASGDGQDDLQALVSLDRGGAMALWSLSDGRCLLFNLVAFEEETRGMLLLPTKSKKYVEFVILYGHANNVNVVRVSTLEVVQAISIPRPLGVMPWAKLAVLLRDASIQKARDGIDGQWWMVLVPVVEEHLAVCPFDSITGKAISPVEYFQLALDFTSGSFENSSSLRKGLPNLLVNAPMAKELTFMLADSQGRWVYLTDGKTIWRGEIRLDQKKVLCTALWMEHAASITRLTLLEGDATNSTLNDGDNGTGSSNSGVVAEISGGESLIILNAPNPLLFLPRTLPSNMTGKNYLLLAHRKAGLFVVEFMDNRILQPAECRLLVYHQKNGDRAWQCTSNAPFHGLLGFSSVWTDANRKTVIVGYLNGMVGEFSMNDFFLGHLDGNQIQLNESQYQSPVTCIHRSYGNRSHRRSNQKQDFDEFITVIGDQKGFLSVFRGGTRVNQHAYHSEAIIGIVEINMDANPMSRDERGEERMDLLLLAVDAAGRCSLGHLNWEAAELEFIGFLGIYCRPLRSLRWTRPNGPLDQTIAFLLHFSDDHYEVWQFQDGSGRMVRQGRIIALEESVLSSFVHQMHLPIFRDSFAFNLPFAADGLDGELFLLVNCLSWRSTLPKDPFLVLVLDVRRLVDGIREMTLTRAGIPGPSLRSSLNLILSWLLPWGYDEELDGLASRLGMASPRSDFTVGMLGANGNLAFPMSLKKLRLEKGQKCRWWSQSPTMTATLYLAISSILELSLDLGEEWDRLRMWFTNRWMDTARRHVPLPSFSFASKYWHDLGEEFRHASRLMIVQTLARLNNEELCRIGEYWTAFLPPPLTTGMLTSHSTLTANDATNTLASSTASGVNLSKKAEMGSAMMTANTTTMTAIHPGGRKIMNRAAIILGILALHHPHLLPLGTLKLVADALVGLMMDERRHLFRAAAIELIGKGFTIWEGHLQALSVFRLLLGWLASMGQVEESTGGNSGGGNAATKSDSGDGMPAGGREDPTPSTPSTSRVAHLVVPFENAATLDTLEAVRSTLVRLVAAAPGDILPAWLHHDVPAYRGLVERWTSVSLLTDLVRQRPRVLCSFLVLIAELLGKLMEQANSVAGGSRTRMAGIISPMMGDLVATFPTVSHHREIHRLVAANISFPNATKTTQITDYRMALVDVRSGGAIRWLEGFTRPITCVDFSPDGRIIVAYSMEEATLRWWHVPGSAFTSIFLGGAVRPFKTEVVEATLTEAILSYQRRHKGDDEGYNEGEEDDKADDTFYASRDYEGDEGIDIVRMNWPTFNTLQILVEDRVVSVINLPES